MDIIVYTHFEVIIITLLIGYMKNIYKLIVKRFLAIFYPPAEFNKISVTVRNRKRTI